jgi:hypothetical protein
VSLSDQYSRTFRGGKLRNTELCVHLIAQATRSSPSPARACGTHLCHGSKTTRYVGDNDGGVYIKLYMVTLLHVASGAALS